jgi:hypothetical protein
MANVMFGGLTMSLIAKILLFVKKALAIMLQRINRDI